MSALASGYAGYFPSSQCHLVVTVLVCSYEQTPELARSTCLHTQSLTSAPLLPHSYVLHLRNRAGLSPSLPTDCFVE